MKKKTFKRSSDSGGKIETQKYFVLRCRKTVTRILPLSWKKSSEEGVVLPTQAKGCLNYQPALNFKHCENTTTNTKGVS